MNRIFPRRDALDFTISRDVHDHAKSDESDWKTLRRNCRVSLQETPENGIADHVMSTAVER